MPAEGWVARRKACCKLARRNEVKAGGKLVDVSGVRTVDNQDYFDGLAL